MRYPWFSMRSGLDLATYSSGWNCVGTIPGLTCTPIVFFGLVAFVPAHSIHLLFCIVLAFFFCLFINWFLVPVHKINKKVLKKY